MRTAYELGCVSLPRYASNFSRHDFTLPQLFACLVVKDFLKLSYRGVEAVLRDCPDWLAEIGMSRVPDHNTLCRAARVIMQECHVEKTFDIFVDWVSRAGVLKLDEHPLAVDSTSFESRHVSRHYEHRCDKTRKTMRAKEAAKGIKSTRSDTTRNLPKLAIGVSTASHLVLSVWTGTGAGADHPNFEPLVSKALRRVPDKTFTVVADAGYDSEENHRLARQDMGLTSLIPPRIGRRRKDGGPPSGKWRHSMVALMETKESRKACGYSRRGQVETTNSMMKRNQGSALAGKSAASRQRDMILRVITHNVMVC